MDGRRLLLILGSLLFLIIGLSGFYRLMVGYPISIGGLQFGQTLSFFIFIVCVVISLILFREARGARQNDLN